MMLQSKNIRWLWLFFLALGLVRLWFSAQLNLAADEAYYWDWSRYLSLGYYDHPPMTAWLAALSCKIFGNTVLGIKFPAFLGWLGMTFFSVILARRFATKLSTLFVVVLSSAFMLLSGVGTMLLTPDIPLILFWSAALWLFYRALFEPFKGVWIVLGAVCGLGLLSKYTFVLFFLIAFLVLISDKSFRKLLPTPGPWLAITAAVVVFLPNIVWNSQNGWISMGFQLAHGLKSKHLIRFDRFGEYLAGQIMGVTPFLFTAVIIAFAKAWKACREDKRLSFFLWFFAVPLGFFMLTSFRQRVEANWPVMAYVSGSILLAWLWDKSRGKGMKIFIGASIAFSALLTVTILVHTWRPFLPLGPKMDPTSKMQGWPELAREAGSIIRKSDPEGKLKICANIYQDAALLSFYMPGQPKVVALGLFGRKNQYTMMINNGAVRLTTPVIFIDRLYDGKIDGRFGAYLKKPRLLGKASLRRGKAPEIVYGVFEVTRGGSSAVRTLQYHGAVATPEK